MLQRPRIKALPVSQGDTNPAANDTRREYRALRGIRAARADRLPPSSMKSYVGRASGDDAAERIAHR